jgi:ribosome-associated protein
LLDIKNYLSYTDLIIICTATSKRQLDALSDALIFSKTLVERSKGKKNGNSDSGWIVIDYGDVVIHLFDEQLRQYYKISDLWKEGKVLLRLK